MMPISFHGYPIHIYFPSMQDFPQWEKIRLNLTSIFFFNIYRKLQKCQRGCQTTKKKNTQYQKGRWWRNCNENCKLDFCKSNLATLKHCHQCCLFFMLGITLSVLQKWAITWFYLNSLIFFPSLNYRNLQIIMFSTYLLKTCCLKVMKSWYYFSSI